MKMVKSLLLGAAAGLVAVAGAQAADLPVKAKPVQYVKICSLYGAGFFYIPGTDTCIKFGGFFRAEENWQAGGSFGPSIQDNFTRASTVVTNRTRFLLTTDVRSQTAYGTLRGYMRAGWQWSSNQYEQGGSMGGAQLTTTANSSTGNLIGPNNNTYLDRVFIQLGGWTFGKTQSFFDFFPTGSYTLQSEWLWHDTGGRGVPVAAYTFGLGNGVTTTLALEDQTETRMGIVGVGNTTTNAYGVTRNNLSITTAGSTSVASNAGNLLPDVIGNLRVDQGWGSAQASVAFHDNRATYWGAGANPGGSPGDKWGWAGQLGVTFNLPMLAKGDTISLSTAYCNGATGYCADAPGSFQGYGGFYSIRKNNAGIVGIAFLEDAYFDAPGNGGLELPQVWNVAFGINHYWMPNFQQSIHAGYLNFKSNSNTVDFSTAAASNSCFMLGLAAGCRNFHAYEVGSRLLWNPVQNLDVGLDVLYTRVNGAYQGVVLSGATPASGLSAVTGGSTGMWAGIVRVQRNFWP